MEETKMCKVCGRELPVERFQLIKPKDENHIADLPVENAGMKSGQCIYENQKKLVLLSGYYDHYQVLPYGIRKNVYSGDKWTTKNQY